MGRNLDRGFEKRIETSRGNNSENKTSKSDSIKETTKKNLYDNLEKK